jgi:hypothetical protein
MATDLEPLDPATGREMYLDERIVLSRSRQTLVGVPLTDSGGLVAVLDTLVLFSKSGFVDGIKDDPSDA